MNTAAVTTLKPPRSRPLDRHDLGIIERRLVAARMELHQAWLFAKGDPRAEQLLIEAGRPLRGALEAINTAQRGSGKL